MASTIFSIAGEAIANFTLLQDEATISRKYDLRNIDEVKAIKQDIHKIINKAGKIDLLVTDKHPDLISHQIATELSKDLKVPLLEVRHHHAHIASVLAENNQFDKQPALGIALDGFGLGENDEAWGGELLFVDKAKYKRLGRIKPLMLLGGDKATGESWRLKLAFLYYKLGKQEAEKVFPNINPLFWQMLAKRINTYNTSSCGRLFDLACEMADIKGETPLARILAFEQMANKEVTNKKVSIRGKDKQKLYQITYNEEQQLYELDVSTLLLQAKNLGSDFPAVFHCQLAEGLAEMAFMAHRYLKRLDTSIVGLSGGCIMNKVLSQHLASSLQNYGQSALFPIRLSASDESVSFGMAHIGKASQLTASTD